MIFGNQNKTPKIQLVVILAVVVFFLILEATFIAGFSATYGGAISLINTALIHQHIRKQNKTLVSPQASVGMMALSAVMRTTLVVVLILLGFVFLKLNANALIMGLVFGLIGFLMDKAGQK